MKTLIIDRAKFLNWYFDEDFDITYSVKDCLLGRDIYMTSIHELLDTTGYIPDWILVDGQEYTLNENGDVDETNVNFIFN